MTIKPNKANSQNNPIPQSIMDIYLENDDSLDLVKKVGIGKDTTLSDHRPIYLHIFLAGIQRAGDFGG